MEVIIASKPPGLGLRTTGIAYTYVLFSVSFMLVQSVPGYKMIPLVCTSKLVGLVFLQNLTFNDAVWKLSCYYNVGITKAFEFKPPSQKMKKNEWKHRSLD